MTIFLFFLNSTLKSQSTSSKPTGLKETSPMYSYTIHKYSIYIYFNPQQTGWTTRFSSKRLTPPSRSQALTTPRLFKRVSDSWRGLFKREKFICAFRKTAWNLYAAQVLQIPSPAKQLWHVYTSFHTFNHAHKFMLAEWHNKWLKVSHLQLFGDRRAR